MFEWFEQAYFKFTQPDLVGVHSRTVAETRRDLYAARLRLVEASAEVARLSARLEQLQDDELHKAAAIETLQT